MKFDQAIRVLSEARDEAVAKLRTAGATERERVLAAKLEMDAAIASLRFCEQHGIEPTSCVTRLPEKHTTTVLSEYRVVEDNETDDRARWLEVRIDGEPVRPLPSALIIEKSSR